jgi:hypothetical protein
MATLLDFIVTFLTSILDLVVIFTTEVALRGDPIALLVFLVGAGLTTASVAFFGYLVVGALLDSVGLSLGSPGRTPPPRGR